MKLLTTITSLPSTVTSGRLHEKNFFLFVCYNKFTCFKKFTKNNVSLNESQQSTKSINVIMYVHLKWARAAMAAMLLQSMIFPSWFITFTSTRICQTCDTKTNLRIHFILLWLSQLLESIAITLQRK